MEATTISRASRTTTIAFATAALLGGSLMTETAEAGSFRLRVKGAAAQGLFSFKNGRTYVKGSVWDTKCDKRMAQLTIEFGSNDRSPELEARGCRKVKNFDLNSQHDGKLRLTLCARSGTPFDFDCDMRLFHKP
jgi:hypothetical protein